MLSVVIPLHNEAGNITPLVGEIRAALAAIPHEIVLVNDGSSDGTLAECKALPDVRTLTHVRACGQSAATQTGVRAARGAGVAAAVIGGFHGGGRKKLLVFSFQFSGKRRGGS
jgi:dolichol-phosphate mannosyltransferase